MRIEHLQQIAEIEKQQSISKAAKELYVAQPYLSTILKNFEQEIGVQIFKRSRNGVSPTPEGEEILAMIKHILTYTDQIIHYKDGMQALCGEVDLLMTRAYRPLIPDILVAFKKAFPNAMLNIQVLLPNEVVDGVSRGMANIGLTLQEQRRNVKTESLGKKNIRYETFHAHKMMLYTHPNHPLAKRSSVEVSDLKNEQFAVYEPYYWTIMYQQLPTLSAPLIVNDNESLKRLISQGHAVSIMPETIADYDLYCAYDLVTKIPLIGEGILGTFVDYLLYPSKRDLNQLEQKTLQILRTIISQYATSNCP